MKFFIRMSIVTQQCVVTISPVPHIFSLDFFGENELYIFGKLRVLWTWKPMLAFFSIQDGRQKSKMAAMKFSFLTFEHQTAVISRASSWSPCFIYFQSRILTSVCFIKINENGEYTHSLLNRMKPDYSWFPEVSSYN